MDGDAARLTLPPGRRVRRGGRSAGPGCMLLCCLLLSGCGGSVQCAPFARSVTGVALYGAAAGWWRESAGRLPHTHIPRPGEILVLAATRRMPLGHVSVVREVVGPREIIVEHANWEPGRIDRHAPVIDVSSDNDWSLVRVWWRPAHRIGSNPYPAYGFILP